MPKLANQKSELTFKNAKPKDKIYSISDGRGLSLTIHPNGSKYWIFRYTRPSTGKPNSISLGPYPEISATEAREKALEARKDVRGLLDPSKKRLETRNAIRLKKDDRFEIVATKWLAFKKKGWSSDTYRKAEYVIHHYLMPHLKSIPMSKLTTGDVQEPLLAIFDQAPALAAKAREYLNGITQRAIQMGIREDGRVLQLSGILPKHRGGNIPAITRPSEIGPLVRAIRNYASPITRIALELTMYTALRPGVVASAPWPEFHFKDAEWHIDSTRMKMPHDHIVPLPRQAITSLRELQKISGDSKWLFPSPSPQKSPHLSRDALSKALREMGFKGKHATHGFRAMLRTVGRERLGIDIDVLEAQLAHAKKDEVQKVYDRTIFNDARRKVMQAWADYLDERARD